MRRIRSAGPMVLACALATALVGGCNGASGGTGPSTTSSAASSTTAPPATTSATTSPTTAPTSAATPTPVANIPTAAKKQSYKGAEAYVRYYIEQTNRSYVQADPEALEGLYLPGCKACASFIKEANRLKAEGQRYVSNPVTIDKFAAGGAKSENRLLVQIQGHQNEVDIVDAEGAVKFTARREVARYVVLVEWKEGRWYVVDSGPDRG